MISQQDIDADAPVTTLGKVGKCIMLDTIHRIPTCRVPAIQTTTQHGHQHCGISFKRVYEHRVPWLCFKSLLYVVNSVRSNFSQTNKLLLWSLTSTSRNWEQSGQCLVKAAYHCKDAMFVLNHRHHTPTSRNGMPNWHLLSESPVSRSLEGLLCCHGSHEL